MAKRKSFVCKTCGRSFSMAAHLGRHMRVHEAVGSRGPKKGTSRRKRTVSSNGQFADLITSLRENHTGLVAERDALDTQIAALESALAAMGSGGAGRNGRATEANTSEFRPGSLKDRIQRVLSDTREPTGIPEITAAVLRSGFKSKNKTLAKSVGIALLDMPGVKKVARGVYGLR